MLKSYFDNTKLGMTKAAYYEACEAFGEDPTEENTPVEYEDLPVDVQLVFPLYSKLRDEWDSINGVYLGKNLVGISDMMKIYGVPESDQKTYLDLILTIDQLKRESILEKKASSK